MISPKPRNGEWKRRVAGHAYAKREREVSAANLGPWDDFEWGMVNGKHHLLQQMRISGDWEAWLLFFVDAIAATANQAVSTAQELNQMYAYSAYIDILNRETP